MALVGLEGLEEILTTLLSVRYGFFSGKAANYFAIKGPICTFTPTTVRIKRT